MKVNKNTEVSKTLTEVEDLATIIKEGTKKTLKDILAESVSEYMKESILKEDEDEDEDKVNPTEELSDDNADVSATEEGSDAEETDDADSEEEEAEDIDDVSVDADAEESEENAEPIDDATDDGNEWDEFEDYKVGDNEYDFTGVKDAATVAKVFKLMKDEDEVSVKKDGDKISISDNEEGTEYVIELNPETEETDESMNVQMTEENVNLGYTDNYQDKDPIEGLKMDGESDWGSEGAPKGTEKPWAGKGDMKPFGAKAEKTEKVFEITLNDETVEEENDDANNEELEEAYGAGGNVQNRSTTMSGAHRTGEKYRNARGPKTTGTSESPLKTESIKNQLDAVIKENKELKSLLQKVKKSLVEAVQVNLNLGNITRLVTENTTSKSEKDEIIKKFSEAKTPAESKALYESFSASLKKAQPTNIVKEDVSLATGSAINETTVYENESANEVLSFMERMAKC